MRPLELSPIFQITNPKAWSKRFLPSQEWLNRIFQTVSDIPSCPSAEISLLFTSNKQMRLYNKRYRGIDSPTNVLSFPTSSSPSSESMLGDIALGLERIQTESKNLNISFEAHLTRMILHGTLHLLGFDHQNPQQTHDMEEKEQDMLAKLGFLDYPFEIEI